MPRLILILLLSLVAADCLAAKPLPLPRFASLKSSEVNVRTGPGARYQVKWLLVKKDMPVEITAEFDQWRKIRDIGGDEGWVHKSMLYGRRSGIINNASPERVTLYKSADTMSRPLLFAENGVTTELLACKREWCRIKIEGTKGWTLRKNLWGVYKDEEFE